MTFKNWVHNRLLTKQFGNHLLISALGYLLIVGALQVLEVPPLPWWQGFSGMILLFWGMGVLKTADAYLARNLP